MEFVLLFLFAFAFALLFNWGQPRVLGYFPTFASNFWAVTALTAVVVAILLVLVSWAFAEVGEEVVSVET